MIRKDLCTGCGACMFVCNKNAITFNRDKNGAMFPEKDAEKCVSCNLCNRVCPVENAPQSGALSLSQNGKTPEILAGFASDGKIRKTSSSGGLFYLLAENILSQNGVVFACRMSDDFKSAEHTAVFSKEDLLSVMGSKYLQSRTDKIYPEIKAALADGKKVLFCGTPCQAAGIFRAVPEKLRENLLISDVVCHGVPVPEIWKKYLEAREKEAEASAKRVSFRKKTDNKSGYSLYIEFENGKVFEESARDNFYLRGFVNNLFLRRSCHSCAFKNQNYESDLTLADFWGSENVFGKDEAQKGVSLMVLRTEKGKKAAEEIKTRAVLKTVDEKSAFKHNPSYYAPSAKNPLSDGFMKKAATKDIDKLLYGYCSSAMLPRIGRKLRRIFKRK